MNQLLSMILLCTHMASCQSRFKQVSISISEAKESDSKHMQHQIHCFWSDGTADSKSIHLEANMRDPNDALIDLVIHQEQTDETTYVKAARSNDKLDFDLPDIGSFQVSLKGNTPNIVSRNSNLPAKNCIRLLSSQTASINKPPTCNAQGTPAAGWYQSGKILTLRDNCKSETMTCGIGSNPGWFVQKKKNIASLKQEKCGWRGQIPTCLSTQGTTGWYLNEKLLAEDTNCQSRNIECSELGTTQEGWYTFSKSAPELLVQSNCISNREISYLAR